MTCQTRTRRWFSKYLVTRIILRMCRRIIRRGVKTIFKTQPSRIIGLITVLLLLVSCSSTQSSEPTSLPPADSLLPFTPTFTTVPHTQTAVLPTPTSTALPPSQTQIEVIKDIPYTSQLKLDVYKPSEPGPWPVVVTFHGGDMIKERF